MGELSSQVLYHSETRGTLSSYMLMATFIYIYVCIYMYMKLFTDLTSIHPHYSDASALVR